MVYKRLLFGLLGAFILSGYFLPLNVSAGDLALATTSTKEFTLVSAMVAEGANIWLPSTLIVKNGDAIKLTLRNVAKVEHGFSIDELGIKEVVQPGETKQVLITPTASGIIRYYCHLHPGHVNGQLLVQ